MGGITSMSADLVNSGLDADGASAGYRLRPISRNLATPLIACSPTAGHSSRSYPTTDAYVDSSPKTGTTLLIGWVRCSHLRASRGPRDSLLKGVPPICRS